MASSRNPLSSKSFPLLSLSCNIGKEGKSICAVAFSYLFLIFIIHILLKSVRHNEQKRRERRDCFMDSLNEVDPMRQDDILVSDDLIRAGCLTLHPARKEVWRDGTMIILTRMEYALLLYLVCHANSVIGREELMLRVWGYASLGYSRTVDVHILHLRKKLSLQQGIQTIYRVGYLFDTAHA